MAIVILFKSAFCGKLLCVIPRNFDRNLAFRGKLLSNMDSFAGSYSVIWIAISPNGWCKFLNWNFQPVIYRILTITVTKSLQLRHYIVNQVHFP